MRLERNSGLNQKDVSESPRETRMSQEDKGKWPRRILWGLGIAGLAYVGLKYI